METRQYFNVSQATTLVQSFPQSDQANIVKVTIYNTGTSTTDVNAAVMTAIGNDSWKYAWTPTLTGVYLIKFYNQSLDVADYLYASVVGSITGTPSPAGTGSTLTVLISKFLQSIDNYNATDIDPALANSSGAIAKICINYGLQKIYAQIKDSKYMRAYPTTALVSTIGQPYIDLGAVSDLDEIETIQDHTNNQTLWAISAWKYFNEIPNPAQSTGTPYRYCRVFNRIYLDPQPAAAITYTCFYVKNFADLSSGSDQALVPSKYDEWIIEEARVKWLMMEDIYNSEAISAAISERNDARAFYLPDVMSQFDKISQTQSHWTRRSGRHYLYERPVG